MAAAIPGILTAAGSIGSGLASLFGGNHASKAGSKLSEDLLNWLRTWINKGGSAGATPGSGIGSLLQGMSDKNKLASEIIPQLRSFYGGLVPRNFSELSPAVEAMKQSEIQGLGTATASARVGQMGALQRRFGGRIPASMYQSGFGQLARGQQEQQTDIGREAIGNNVALGAQGAAGLAQLPYMANPGLSDFLSLLSGGMSGIPQADASKAQGFASLAGGIGNLLAQLMGKKSANTLPPQVIPNNLPMPPSYPNFGGA